MARNAVLGTHKPGSTLLVVAQLASADLYFEVEGIAGKTMSQQGSGTLSHPLAMMVA